MKQKKFYAVFSKKELIELTEELKNDYSTKSLIFVAVGHKIRDNTTEQLKLIEIL